MTARDWIKRLKLTPHPEGGYFRETYRSRSRDRGLKRNHATAIYYLLDQGQISRFHRLTSDELWFYHEGSGIKLHLLGPGQSASEILLNRQRPQALIPAGMWFAAEPAGSGWGLASCVVAPGFDFRDFTLADRFELSDDFPRMKKLIARFTSLSL